VVYSANIVGIPGSIDYQLIRPESINNPRKAINARPFKKKVELELGLWPKSLDLADKNGNPNNFEATVEYSNAGNRRYFPVGATGNPVYDNLDNVLTVFTKFAWYGVKDPTTTPQTIGWLDPPICQYQPAPFVNVD
jgi:hypothetical protein